MDTDSKVWVQGDHARIKLGGDTLNLPIQPLSAPLLDWFIQGRKDGYESLSRGGGPGPLFSRHLPVVATTNETGSFPTRMAHKGVGLLPQPDRLEEHIDRYETLLDRTSDLPPSRSLSERLQNASRSIEDPGSLDSRVLGSLEIFAGGTFANLKRRPVASLLFTDPDSGYRSFQLDCAVQIVEPPDPYFRFLFLARMLFERYPFHITQPGVRCAYLFWIVGIHDKTPHPVEEGKARHKL